MIGGNVVARRIGQLIRLLSSDHPGEAGAAAQALNRTLTSAGLDIHELAKVAEVGLKLPAKQSARHQQARTTTHRHPDGGRLVVGQGPGRPLSLLRVWRNLLHDQARCRTSCGTARLRRLPARWALAGSSVF
jgi:hypothetical protein